MKSKIGIESVLRRPSIKRLADSVSIKRVSKQTDAQLQLSFSLFLNEISVNAIANMESEDRLTIIKEDIEKSIENYPLLIYHGEIFVYSDAPCRKGIWSSKKGCCRGPKNCKNHIIEHGLCDRECHKNHGDNVIHHYFPFSSFKSYFKILMFMAQQNPQKKARIKQDALEYLYVITQYHLQLILRRGKSYYSIAGKATLNGEHILLADQSCDNDILDIPLKNETDFKS